jgi:hypothetical protein
MRLWLHARDTTRMGQDGRSFAGALGLQIVRELVVGGLECCEEPHDGVPAHPPRRLTRSGLRGCGVLREQRVHQLLTICEMRWWLMPRTWAMAVMGRPSL